MLVLTRKKGEQIVIRLGAETVIVRIADVTGERVRLGVTAPQSVAIHREEVARRIQEWQHDLDGVLAGSAPQR